MKIDITKQIRLLELVHDMRNLGTTWNDIGVIYGKSGRDIRAIYIRLGGR